MARPIPLAAPVTNAVLLAFSFMDIDYRDDEERECGVECGADNESLHICEGRRLQPRRRKIRGTLAAAASCVCEGSGFDRTRTSGCCEHFE